MTSEKQIQANRRNALKSTGPKTPEGKAAVRHNALRHGLLSRDVLLPGEDKGALIELGERLRDELLSGSVSFGERGCFAGVPTPWGRGDRPPGRAGRPECGRRP
jgi:hypothetical protein